MQISSSLNRQVTLSSFKMNLFLNEWVFLNFCLSYPRCSQYKVQHLQFTTHFRNGFYPSTSPNVSRALLRTNTWIPRKSADLHSYASVQHVHLQAFNTKCVRSVSAACYLSAWSCGAQEGLLRYDADDTFMHNKRPNTHVNNFV